MSDANLTSVTNRSGGPTLPLVSVVIPVRNCCAYIGEAVDSVCTQSYPSLEVIVVDDGSDDWDYKQLELLDPRIRVHVTSASGVSHARNFGIKQARGEYIAFLDADDIWFPGKLAAQVRYFERHPEAGVVFGDFIRWEADAQGRFGPAKQLTSDCSAVESSDPARSGWLYNRLFGGLLVGMNTATVRRDVVDAIGGFNEAMRHGEDYDFWLRASRISEMHALAAPIALYRIHGGSAMHRLSGENDLLTLLISALMRWGVTSPQGEHLTEKQVSRRLAQVAFNHGYRHFWYGDRTIARRSFIAAARQGYRLARSLSYLALSVLVRKAP